MRSSIFTIISPFFLIVGAVTPDEDPRRFKIVSEYATARQFYPEIRATKTAPNELSMELDEKKAICKDIITSHYIKQRLSYELFFRVPRLHVRRREPLHLCPTKLQPVTLGPGRRIEENFLEWVFVCPARRNLKRKPEAFYISEEYRIGGDVNSTDNYIAGRFIFRFFADKVRLDGLAEATAKILSWKNEDIEKIYIRRRIGRELASSPVDDPLCTSKRLDKIRICAAIFSAMYFWNEINYPENNWVSGSCEKRIISFRDEESTARALDGSGSSYGSAESNLTDALPMEYEEWMMNCNPHDEDHPKRFPFLLSQAYEPNEIFVFAEQPRDASVIFLEGRAINIRFTVS